MSFTRRLYENVFGFGWHTNGEEIRDLMTFRQIGGSPAGILTPRYIGEDVWDVTNGRFYRACSMSPTGWRTLLGSVDDGGGDPGPGPGPGPDPVVGAHGMNFVAPGYPNSEFPFRNLLRNCSRWRPTQIGESWDGWDQPLPPMDANHYPLSIPDGWQMQVFFCQNIANDVLGQECVLLYDGEGTFSFANGLTVTESTPGRIRFNLNGSTAPVFNLLTTGTDGNHVTNIRIYEEQYEDLDSFFRPPWLAFLEGFTIVRFMDWMNTNHSFIESFDQWPTLDRFPNTRRPEGHISLTPDCNFVPIEIMCALANETGASPWFCMPHLTDNAFCTSFAQAVLEHIDPDIPVHVEHSNEVWNFMFQQTDFAVEQGEAAGLGVGLDAGVRWHADRTTSLLGAWDAVMPGRVVGVYGGWVASSYHGGLMMQRPGAAARCDILAIAPYFGGHLGNPFDPEEGPNSWLERTKAGGLPFIFDQITQRINTEVRGWLSNFATLAELNDIRIGAYEAGQHIAGIYGGENDDDFVALQNAANHDPRMGAAYALFMQHWNDILGELAPIVWYTSIGTYTKWGAWGVQETESDTANPKILAIRASIDAEPVDPTDPDPGGDWWDAPEYDLYSVVILGDGRVAMPANDANGDPDLTPNNGRYRKRAGTIEEALVMVAPAGRTAVTSITPFTMTMDIPVNAFRWGYDAGLGRQQLLYQPAARFNRFRLEDEDWQLLDDNFGVVNGEYTITFRGPGSITWSGMALPDGPITMQGTGTAESLTLSEHRMLPQSNGIDYTVDGVVRFANMDVFGNNVPRNSARYQSTWIPTAGERVDLPMETIRFGATMLMLMQRAEGTLVVKGHMFGPAQDNTDDNRRVIVGHGNPILGLTHDDRLMSLNMMNRNISVPLGRSSGDDYAAAVAWTGSSRRLCANGGEPLLVSDDWNEGLGDRPSIIMGKIEGWNPPGEAGAGGYDMIAISPRAMNAAQITAATAD